MAALLRAGRVVLVPFGDNQRYDLVVENHGVFSRIQCKTGRYSNGVVAFSTCSITFGEKVGRRDYKGQADVFGVYCPELDKVYLVPVEVVGKVGAKLRVDPPKNGQRTNIRLAQEFELTYL